MRRFLLPLTILASGLSGFAQTTYTAHLFTGLTQAAATGQVCFHLKNYGTNIPVVVGTGVVVDTDPPCVPANLAGLVTGTIYGSDVITPIGSGCVPSALNPCTWWTVEYWVNGQMKSTADYTTIVGSSVLLDSLLPLMSYPVSPPINYALSWPFASNFFLTSYNQITGLFTAAQPSSASLSDASTVEHNTNRDQANGYPSLTSAGKLQTSEFPASIPSNAATASGAASAGSECASGQASRGVDASWNAMGCFTPTGAGNMTNTGTPVVGGIPKYSDTTGTNIVPSTLSESSLNGFRNRLINGAFDIIQRYPNGSGQTVTAGAALAYGPDRWFIYSTGANVTAVQAAAGSGFKNALQITGAASVTAVGVAQRIEAANVYDLAGTTVTLSCYASSSTLTTLTWTAYYATTSADTFGTLASPTETQIATGTWTISGALTRYSAQISLPAGAANGVEIRLTTGAFTGGTLTITGGQLEAGAMATPFERRSVGLEMTLAQRYCQVITFLTGYYTSLTNGIMGVQFNPPMRTTPTAPGSNTALILGNIYVENPVGNNPSITAASIYYGNNNSATLSVTMTGGNGSPTFPVPVSTYNTYPNGGLVFCAEL
jgi:hypothetical protein